MERLETGRLGSEAHVAVRTNEVEALGRGTVRLVKLIGYVLNHGAVEVESLGH